MSSTMCTFAIEELARAGETEVLIEEQIRSYAVESGLDVTLPCSNGAITLGYIETLVGLE